MLIQKLKIKSGEVVLIDAPKDVRAELEAFKAGTKIPPKAKESLDFVLLFATKSMELTAKWKQAVPALKKDAIFWIAYPKKSSGIQTDLGLMSGGWTAYAGSPWQPVASISINDTWTGLRFKYAPNLEESRKERQSENIHDADGTMVVDRINREIHPPKDLAQLLSRHPEARILFEGLSFTNRKEYVLWIVEAKRKETREARLQSTVERLLSGKKNPSDK